MVYSACGPVLLPLCYGAVRGYSGCRWRAYRVRNDLRRGVLFGEACGQALGFACLATGCCLGLLAASIVGQLGLLGFFAACSNTASSNPQWLGYFLVTTVFWLQGALATTTLGWWLRGAIVEIRADGRRCSQLSRIVEDTQTMLRRYIGLPDAYHTSVSKPSKRRHRVWANPANPSHLWMIGEIRSVLTHVAKTRQSGEYQVAVAITSAGLVLVILAFIATRAGNFEFSWVAHPFLLVFSTCFVCFGLSLAAAMILVGAATNDEHARLAKELAALRRLLPQAFVVARNLKRERGASETALSYDTDGGRGAKCKCSRHRHTLARESAAGVDVAVPKSKKVLGGGTGLAKTSNMTASGSTGAQSGTGDPGLKPALKPAAVVRAKPLPLRRVASAAGCSAEGERVRCRVNPPDRIKHHVLPTGYAVRVRPHIGAYAVGVLEVGTTVLVNPACCTDTFGLQWAMVSGGNVSGWVMCTSPGAVLVPINANSHAKGESAVHAPPPESSSQLMVDARWCILAPPVGDAKVSESAPMDTYATMCHDLEHMSFEAESQLLDMLDGVINVCSGATTSSCSIIAECNSACGVTGQDALANQRKVKILGLTMDLKLFSTAYSVLAAVVGVIVAEGTSLYRS